MRIFVAGADGLIGVRLIPLAFLAGVTVLYIQTALQASWGRPPPLWPVFVGVVGVIVVAMIGFICGVLFPGRITAPLVTIAHSSFTRPGSTRRLWGRGE